MSPLVILEGVAIAVRAANIAVFAAEILSENVFNCAGVGVVGITMSASVVAVVTVVGITMSASVVAVVTVVIFSVTLLAVVDDGLACAVNFVELALVTAASLLVLTVARRSFNPLCASVSSVINKF